MTVSATITFTLITDDDGWMSMENVKAMMYYQFDSSFDSYWNGPVRTQYSNLRNQLI